MSSPQMPARYKKIGHAFKNVCDGVLTDPSQSSSIKSPYELGKLLAQISYSWPQKDSDKVTPHDFQEPISILRGHWKSDQQDAQTQKVKSLMKALSSQKNLWGDPGEDMFGLATRKSSMTRKNLDDLALWISSCEEQEEQQSTWSSDLSRCMMAYCLQTKECSSDLGRVLHALSLAHSNSHTLTDTPKEMQGVVRWCFSKIMALSSADFISLLDTAPRALTLNETTLAPILLLKAGNDAASDNGASLNKLLNHPQINVFRSPSALNVLLEDLPDSNVGVSQQVVCSPLFSRMVSKQDMIKWLSKCCEHLDADNRPTLMKEWISHLLPSLLSSKEGYDLLISKNFSRSLGIIVKNAPHLLGDNLDVQVGPETKSNLWRSIMMHSDAWADQILGVVPSSSLPQIFAEMTVSSTSAAAKRVDRLMQSLDRPLATECLFAICQKMMRDKEMEYCSSLVEGQHLKNEITQSHPRPAKRM